MRTNRLRAVRLTATMLLAMASSKARANCDYTSELSFQPIQNDTVKAQLACDLEGMRIVFTPGSGHVFTSSESIGPQVNIQVLQSIDASTVDFPPTAAGPGSFGLKVCATRRKRSGCSTIF